MLVEPILGRLDIHAFRGGKPHILAGGQQNSDTINAVLRLLHNIVVDMGLQPERDRAAIFGLVLVLLFGP